MKKEEASPVFSYEGFEQKAIQGLYEKKKDLLFKIFKI